MEITPSRFILSRPTPYPLQPQLIPHNPPCSTSPSVTTPPFPSATRLPQSQSKSNFFFIYLGSYPFSHCAAPRHHHTHPTLASPLSATAQPSNHNNCFPPAPCPCLCLAVVPYQAFTSNSTSQFRTVPYGRCSTVFVPVPSEAVPFFSFHALRSYSGLDGTRFSLRLTSILF